MGKKRINYKIGLLLIIIMSCAVIMIVILRLLILELSVTHFPLYTSSCEEQVNHNTENLEAAFGIPVLSLTILPQDVLYELTKNVDAINYDPLISCGILYTYTITSSNPNVIQVRIHKQNSVTSQFNFFDTSSVEILCGDSQQVFLEGFQCSTYPASADFVSSCAGVAEHNDSTFDVNLYSSYDLSETIAIMCHLEVAD